ncbi:HemK2/MTQ2 family protein methyltransferase [Streptomyces sp. NPDC006326]|uniref:HemK2/MTQ2 family protein methyltransferase n=1 Tax=Streptomyces sp. NPDC006326 TaxID=3156752 RepID=UPI0033BE2F68
MTTVLDRHSRFRDLARLWRLPGVYAPQEDTYLLARALDAELAPGMDVLDIGTGSGALALRAARGGARVTAVDVSWRAALTARLNAARAGQPITVRRGGIERARPEGPFDLVVSNPPYVPAPDHRLPRRGPARSWDGGRDGRRIVDGICAAAPSLLKPRGVLLIVQSALCGTDATLEALGRAGLDAEVVDRDHIPFGPVLRSRLPWLRSQGLVEPRQETEELVVIRAERPRPGPGRRGPRTSRTPEETR